MPELHGKPFKDELYARVSQLESTLRKERKARDIAETRLEIANCKIAELEAKIQRMQQQARAIVTEAARDVSGAARERFLQSENDRKAAAHKAAHEASLNL